MNQTKRLQYLDVVKGFGIILVVFGHIEYISQPLRIWLSSFHMPLFFLVSGMLIRYKNEPELSMSALLTRKARGILVPYLWFSLLYFFINILNVAFGKITIETFLQDGIDTLTFYGMSVLWFLPALFLAEILFFFLTKRLPQLYSILLILVLAVSSVFAETSLKPLAASLAGNLLLLTLINFLRIFLRAAIACAFVCTAYYTFPLLRPTSERSVLQLLLGILFFLVNLVLSQINGGIDFHYLVFANFPLFFLNALIGTSGVVLICKNIPHLAPVAFFGKDSLIVMATHVNTYFLYAGIKVAWFVDTIVTRAKTYVFLFNIMAVTFLLEAIAIVIIHKFFPFVLGKPFPLWMNRLFHRKGRMREKSSSERTSL